MMLTYRSRGAIMTDSSMYIGAYNSTDQQGAPAFVAFVVGDDYWNQKEIFRLTTNGLEMPLATKKIFYEAGKTPQANPASYTDLRCDTVTGEIYAAAGTADPIAITDRHIIVPGDVANNYLDLTQSPIMTEHIFVYLNGMYLDMEVVGDYTLSGNRITFITPITVDDKVIIKYSYV